ncbi:NADase-type glycan-binding domain-containing protein [Aquimarina sediminis]|uniref:NADase-type glycan-binding domain-containing protein n=1 Tax=Aquimarina sediminis TaxID=2070536 RepID=UPI000C9FFF62|nr:hypothetical protein [Aquimarina sediminis]
MKKVLVYILFVSNWVATAQEIKTLTPSVEMLDFNVADEKEFYRNREICEKIWERMSNGLEYDDLTDIEKAELEKVDETKSNYWSVEGDGCSWYCGGGPSEVKASSSLASQGSINYKPANAHDLNYKNVWVEGVKGHGVGEYLEYGFPQSSPRITEIIVVNGHVKSERAWRSNSRVKKLKIYIKDKPYAILNLKDQRAAQHFKVDTIGFLDKNIDFIAAKKLPLWKMKFEILEVYPGDKYDDTVISEIYFDGIDVHCFAKGTLITMADHSKKVIESLKIGDQVLSYNQDTKTYEASTIEKLASPIHDHLIKIIMVDGTSIRCTQDHPFLSATGNWISYDPQKTKSDYLYTAVDQLKIGSIVKTSTGEGEISNIELLQEPQQTYTIVELDKGITYLANDIVVGTEPIRKDIFCKKHNIAED